MSVAVEVNGLEKIYKGGNGVRDINFTVEEGNVVGMIGLNGAGKTTILKCLTSSIRNFKGEIKIFGHHSEEIEAKKKYSFLPEVFVPPPYLKGIELIDLFSSMAGRKTNKELVRELCEILDFPHERLDEKIGNYSKGMKQKVSLIATICCDTPLFVLDEPMSGLDPLARFRLKQLFMSLKNNGKTLLFASHILSDVEELADKIVVIHEGHVIFTGSPSELIDSKSAKTLEEAFMKLIGGVH
jgi:ABC-2 type transport system ATP-binding protein